VPFELVHKMRNVPDASRAGRRAARLRTPGPVRAKPPGAVSANNHLIHGTVRIQQLAQQFNVPARKLRACQNVRPQAAFFGRRRKLAITNPTNAPVMIPPIPATSAIFLTASAVIGLLKALTDA